MTGRLKLTVVLLAPLVCLPVCLSVCFFLVYLFGLGWIGFLEPRYIYIYIWYCTYLSRYRAELAYPMISTWV